MKTKIQLYDTQIRQDEQGRFCLNDLHQASGGESRHRPAYWLSNQQTQELIGEISKDGIPSILTKQGLGTFVSKELVYAYAMWISPKFHLYVIRTFDSLAGHQNPTALIPQSFSEALMLAAQLQAEKEQNAPKVEAFDRLATATEGAMNLTNAAKHLQMQPRAFNLFLFANGWIYKRAVGSAWIAYQDKLQRGYLEHKAHPVTQPDGTEKIYPQVLVTAKGLAKLSTMLNKATV